MSSRRRLIVAVAVSLLVMSGLGIVGTADPSCATCGISSRDRTALSQLGPAEGRYIDVQIETFRSWGFFGLGTWFPMETRLLAVRIDPLPAGDAARVEGILEACARGEGEPEACATLAGLGYGLVRSFGITPDLDSTYRVVLTNKTESLLGLVLEIDGLNTNGSEELVETDEDKKWVLLPGQTVRISGWQVSTDEALAFRFTTPSQSHSPLADRRGVIRVHVYLLDPMDEYVKGTEAAEVVDQPTVRIAFRSATEFPVERIDFSYARGEVGLGFSCEETSGAGVRVSEVKAGTIAELKGLKEDDVITYINAVPIDSCSDLLEFLASKVPGDRVVVKVHRKGRAFLLTLELEE